MLDLGRALTNMPHTPQDISAMDEEVNSLLHKEAIEQVHGHSQPRFFLLPFPSAKKGRGKRPVINLKPLNEYIRRKTFLCDHSQGGGPVHSSLRLVHHHRPAERAPSYPGAQGLPQAPSIFMEGEDISVQHTAIRSDVFTSSFRRHHTTAGVRLLSQGYTRDILFGHPGEKEGVSLPAQRFRFETAVKCRFQTQSKQVVASELKDPI